ncbi:hypothetical protein PAPYR_6649 [Paratrimastix pyriformis]|uniref:Uncharacterized protein n=1 Tax=Paratrimastix pyriformis TaxID=342808 RepID=A0ABQ8UEZ6_9EUKA|nr:hypothetical protein PAPYR_6649 [Paratrimastix pyriformis]
MDILTRTPELYCFFLSLNHPIRNLVQGSIRTLAFPEDAPHCPTESLVALSQTTTALEGRFVHLCWSLQSYDQPELRFPPICHCGRLMTLYDSWIRAITQQHAETLRIVEVPSGEGLSEAALCHLLRLLPHLDSLHVGTLTPALYSQPLLDTIDALPAPLESLRLLLRGQIYSLAPRAHPLRHLELSDTNPGVFTRFLADQPRLESLVLHPARYGTADFHALLVLPAAATLRHLSILRCSAGTLGSITKCHFGCLESLELSCKTLAMTNTASLCALLLANASTLRRLVLRDLPSILLSGDVFEVVTRRLPALVDLTLAGPDRSFVETALEPLLGRLVRLSLQTGIGGGPAEANFTNLRAPRLRQATLQCRVLRVECPVLEDLTLGSAALRGSMVLDCPCLQSLTNLPPELLLRTVRPLAALRTLRCLPSPTNFEPAWLAGLAECCPGLQELSGVMLTQAATLQALCDGSLAPHLTSLRGVTLQAPHMGVASFYDDLTLRLTPSMKTLEIGTAFMRLCLRGTHRGDCRITQVAITNSHRPQRPDEAAEIDMTACAQLTELRLGGCCPARRVALPPETPLCSMALGLPPSPALLDLIMSYGPGLRRLDFASGMLLSDVLARLTSLTSLEFATSLEHPVAEWTLALPQLRELTGHLVDGAALGRLVVACPALERVQFPMQAPLAVQFVGGEEGKDLCPYLIWAAIRGVGAGVRATVGLSMLKDWLRAMPGLERAM